MKLFVLCCQNRLSTWKLRQSQSQELKGCMSGNHSSLPTLSRQSHGVFRCIFHWDNETGTGSNCEWTSEHLVNELGQRKEPSREAPLFHLPMGKFYSQCPIQWVRNHYLYFKTLLKVLFLPCFEYYGPRFHKDYASEYIILNCTMRCLVDNYL